MSAELLVAEFDAPDPTVRKTKERQMAMYTIPALRAAAKVERAFVGYPVFQRCLQAIDRAFQLSGELELPKGVIISGPTGCGKTSILRYYLESLPQQELLTDEFTILTLRLQEKPTLGRTVTTLLRKLRYPFPEAKGATISIKRDILLETLRHRRTRLLMVDEASAMCTSRVKHGRDSASGNEITEFLRELIDESGLVVVLAGDETLSRLPAVDSALAARLPIVERLQDMVLDRTWQALLKAFCGVVSNIDLQIVQRQDMDHLLHIASTGNFRRLKALLVEATLIAVDRQSDAVSATDLEQAYDRAFGGGAIIANPFRSASSKEKRHGNT